MRNPVEEFEAQYQRHGDPWALATSPYETERYDTIITALSGRRYHRALELGASIGVLTERLAPLCDEIIALEPAPTAVRALRERLAPHEHVDALQGSVPEELPDGPFDLIVASEVLYYFSADELPGVVDALRARLDGTLIAVHWRGLGTHQMTGPEVHDVLRRKLHVQYELQRLGYVLATMSRGLPEPASVHVRAPQ